jgi:hypothetical protein
MKGQIDIPNMVGEPWSDTEGEEMVGEDVCDSSSGERILCESNTWYDKKFNQYLWRMVDSKGWLAVWSLCTVLSASHQKDGRNSKWNANLTVDNEGSWWYQQSRTWTLIVDMNDGRKERSVCPSQTEQFYSLFPNIWCRSNLSRDFFFDAAMATMLNLDSTYQTPWCQFRRTTLHKGNWRHKGTALYIPKTS